MKGNPDNIYWSDTLNIYVEENIVNTDKIAIASPKIYPNPASDIVNIEFLFSGNMKTVIELLNVTGKVIYRKEYINTRENNIEKIDVSGLPAGMYFVKVRQVDGVFVGKVFVK